MSHQKGRLKNSKFWLCLSLILCLVSAIVASAVQTSGGIRIKEMSWESPSGHQLAAYLYIPQNATKDTPAPGVVTIEGWYNNKEMQDLYSIELARRGYVVLALDLHSHGDSESLSIAELYDGAVGVDGAVQLIASLPYVDTARIGVTGHSSGGTAANMAVEIDNSRETPLIAAVLQQAGDWQDDTGGDHSGDYGSRSVGIIASTHDDFYFGTYDDAGNMLTNPVAFMETDGAKKFLNFNEDGFASIAEGGKYYTRDFDGKTAYRVIYRPNMIHPLVAFSTTCVGYAVDFFDTTLGAPKPLPASDQIWPIKAVFNSLGVIGLLIFMVSFTLVLLDTPVFSALRSGEIVQPAPVQDSGAKAWYWVLLIIGAVFSGSSFLFCMNTVYSKTTNFFVQTGPLTIGTWAALCGIFAIFCSAVFYGAYGKKHGWSARRAGLYLNLEQLWKTIALAVIVIVVSFGLVFAAHYFFQVDYRMYVVAFKTFGADKVLIALRYLPFFLLFYVMNSISANCFNYNTIGGKNGNILIFAFFNALGAIFVVASQYIYFYATGYQLYGLTEGQRIGPIWLFPCMVLLFVTPIMSRIIYKRTRNPYIAGLINAMFIVMISCSNTTTILGGGELIATTF